MAWSQKINATPDISESSFLPPSIERPVPVETSSSWSWSSLFNYFKLPSSTVGIFVAVSTGLTLIGATSYFVVTRYYSSKRQKSIEDGELSEEEFYYELTHARKR